MFYHALTGNGGTTPTEDLEPVLLWTNSNPTARFDAQTISLNLTDYAGVIVEFYAEDDKQTLAARSYLKKDDIINGSNFGTGHTDATSTAASRNYTINNDGVTFSSGYFSNSATTEVLIPYKIYGVKSYVVEPAVGDLLWHNNTSAVELDYTEIDGDYSKYSKILVKGRYSTTNDFPLESVVFKNSTYYSGLLACKIGNETLYRGIIFTDTKITINTNFIFTSGTPTRNNI